MNDSILSEGLRLVALCPLCKSKEATDVMVLESVGEGHVVHVTCRQCRQALLVRITRVPNGISCVGLVTDLSPEDAKRMRTAPALTEDDVLRVHESLTDGALWRAVVSGSGLTR